MTGVEPRTGVRTDLADRVRHANDWARLSVVPEKERVFGDETYFRECWADMADRFDRPPAEELAPLALLTFKPDAVVGRRMAPTLDYLTRNHFQPIGVLPLHYSRHSMRELWRYNWHVYTTDRLELCTLIYQSAESLLLMLYDVSYDGGVPGSVRLSELRGPAEEARREPHHLRTLLRPPNRILNFVHVADEPADIVRELGVFFDRPLRRQLIEALRRRPRRDASPAVCEQISRLERAHGAHPLDLDGSLRRLGRSAAVSRDAFAHLTAAIERRQKLTWDQLCSVADPHAPAVGVWDFICVACEVLVEEREARTQPLPASTRVDWERHAGGRADLDTGS